MRMRPFADAPGRLELLAKEALGQRQNAFSDIDTPEAGANRVPPCQQGRPRRRARVSRVVSVQNHAVLCKSIDCRCTLNPCRLVPCRHENERRLIREGGHPLRQAFASLTRDRCSPDRRPIRT